MYYMSVLYVSLGVGVGVMWIRQRAQDQKIWGSIPTTDNLWERQADFACHAASAYPAVMDIS